MWSEVIFAFSLWFWCHVWGRMNFQMIYTPFWYLMMEENPNWNLNLINSANSSWGSWVGKGRHPGCPAGETHHDFSCADNCVVVITANEASHSWGLLPPKIPRLHHGVVSHSLGKSSQIIYVTEPSNLSFSSLSSANQICNLPCNPSNRLTA